MNAVAARLRLRLRLFVADAEGRGVVSAQRNLPDLFHVRLGRFQPVLVHRQQALLKIGLQKADKVVVFTRFRRHRGQKNVRQLGGLVLRDVAGHKRSLHRVHQHLVGVLKAGFRQNLFDQRHRLVDIVLHADKLRRQHRGVAAALQLQCAHIDGNRVGQQRRSGLQLLHRVVFRRHAAQQRRIEGKLAQLVRRNGGGIQHHAHRGKSPISAVEVIIRTPSASFVSAV